MISLSGTLTILTGIALLMLGVGLQGTLIGTRASLEGFSVPLIGAMMGSFYLGFLIGAVWAGRAIKSVGHVRVFAALTSLASITILVQALVIEPLTWGLMRFLTGLCLAGIFVTAESWLNASSDAKSRGGILGAYMFVTFLSTGAGQFLMLASDPLSPNLFVTVSILLSLAAVPLLLVKVPAPALEFESRIRLFRLFRVSPLGVTGVFVAGVLNGSIFGMAPVYAQRVGMTLSETSTFMAAMIAGAILFQLPLGRLSDLVDRRLVLTILLFLTALVAGVLFARDMPEGRTFFALSIIFGGSGLAIHALAMAHTNDFLEPSELVSASVGLVVVLGLGSITGPLVLGLTFDMLGNNSFFGLTALVAGLGGLYALFRMSVRDSLPMEAQGGYQPVTPVATPVVVAVAEEAHAEDIQEGEAS